jgi:hypothetical protein
MILAVPALLVFIAGLVCSFLGCVVPFAALAAFAAIYVSPRVAIVTVLATWLLNQVLGFTIHHYPTDASTFAWGVAIGISALVAYALSRVARGNLAVSFVVSFVAFEAVLMLFSVRLGDWGAYAPKILLMLFLTNAAWFAGMAAAVTYGLRLHPSR